MAIILTKKKKKVITMEDINCTKEKQSRSKTKTMLTAFFDVEGRMHHEFLSKGSAFEMQSVSNHVTDVCQYVASGPQQCGVPSGPKCWGVLGQAYVVGSKSFRPDQLFKVTEIKQLCYFST